MADRDRFSRDRYDRYDRDLQQNDSRDSWRQAEQYQSDEDSGYRRDRFDPSETDYARNAYGGSERGDYRTDGDRQRTRGFGSENAYAQSRSAGGGYHDPGSRGPRDATHDYFRGDDFGGSNYVGGGYAGGGYAMGGRAPASGPDRYGQYGGYGGRNDPHERGFFERAGDEIASWFGDEDAERRRERDHRGRGPSNYTRSDERLLEDACERLTHDPRVDASNVTVSVGDGEITLDGTVDSRSAKRRAEDCVYDVSGITHVQNNLRIDTSNAYGNTAQSNENG